MANHRALKNRDSAGKVAIPTDLASDQGTQWANQGVILDAHGERRTVRSSCGTDHRVCQHNHMVSNFDGGAATLNDGIVVNVT